MEQTKLIEMFQKKANEKMLLIIAERKKRAELAKAKAAAPPAAPARGVAPAAPPAAPPAPKKDPHEMDPKRRKK